MSTHKTLQGAAALQNSEEMETLEFHSCFGCQFPLIQNDAQEWSQRLSCQSVHYAIAGRVFQKCIVQMFHSVSHLL